MKFLRDFFTWRADKRVLDLQSQLDEKDRLISVLKAEIDGLAEVIARDRQRVLAETAQFARQQAEAEGMNERYRQGDVRRSA